MSQVLNREQLLTKELRVSQDQPTRRTALTNGLLSIWRDYFPSLSDESRPDFLSDRAWEEIKMAKIIEAKVLWGSALLAGSFD